MSLADPTNAATYEINGKRYANELSRLDDYARDAVAASQKPTAKC
jgi:ABC-type Zn uptake system ZnuABC Zn-binding protein ZnuA